MRFLLVATLAALPFFAPPAPALAQVATPPEYPFTCPAAGTVVTDDQRGVRRYDGTDPADPLVCLMRFTPRDRPEVPLRLLAGVFMTVPGADAEARHAAAAALLPWRAGRVIRFTTPGRDGQPDQMEWEVQSIEMVGTPAGVFRTATILERATSRGPDGAPAQGHFIHRIDVATGTFLAFAGEIQHGGTSTRARPSQAKQIERPN